MREWPIRWSGVRLRTALAAALVVCTAVLITAAALVFTSESTLSGNIDEALAQRAAQVSAVLESEDKVALEQSLRPSAKDQTLIQIIDSTGKVQAASPAIAGQPALTSLRPQQDMQAWDQRTLAFAPEDPLRILAQGVTTSRGDQIVIVAQSLARVNESMEVITDAVVIGTPILAILVGLATFYFVGRSLRPVEAIRRQTQTITASQLHSRVPVPAARDEIAALASTMNEMLDRLESSAGIQRRFIADASHELRSPLATIQIGLDLLVAKSDDPGIQRLQAETQRLGHLVADLLLLARVEDYGLPARYQDVDLDDLMHAQKERLQAEQPNLALQTKIQPIRVRGDARQLERALRNLCDNAARHAHTAVSLAVWADSQHAFLAVGDDGPGIPDGEIDRVSIGSSGSTTPEPALMADSGSGSRLRRKSLPGTAEHSPSAPAH